MERILRVKPRMWGAPALATMNQKNFSMSCFDGVWLKLAAFPLLSSHNKSSCFCKEMSVFWRRLRLMDQKTSRYCNEIDGKSFVETVIWVPSAFIPHEQDILARVFLLPDAFLSETPVASFLSLLRRKSCVILNWKVLKENRSKGGQNRPVWEKKHLKEIIFSFS